MEPKFKKTFIPQKPVMGSPKKKKKTINLFSLLASGIFIAALVAGGGLFGYEKYLEGRISNLDTELDQIRSDFTPDVIEELLKVDAQLDVAQELLAKHVSLSSYFDLLGATTLHSLRFNNFSYSQTEEGHTVQMSGEALSFPNVALQSDVFLKNAFISDNVFGSLNWDKESRRVTFSVKTILEPKLILYEEGLVPIETPSLEPTIEPEVEEVATSTNNTATTTEQ